MAVIWGPRNRCLSSHAIPVVEQRNVLSAAQERFSAILVVTADGEGIPMFPENLRDATRKAAQQGEPKLQKRRSKGEKGNRKRMAAVAAVYSIASKTFRAPRSSRARKEVRQLSKGGGVGGNKPGIGEGARGYIAPNEAGKVGSVHHDFGRAGRWLTARFAALDFDLNA